MDTNRTCYLFLDYDGTVFLRGEIPQSVRKALATVREAGHQVILNTGRSRGGLDFANPQNQGVDWDGVLYGGADYTYRGERRVLGKMDPAECEAWFRSAMERGAWVNVECDKENQQFLFNKESLPLTEAKKQAFLEAYRMLTDGQTLMKLSVGVTTVEGEPTEGIHVVDQKTYLELFPKELDKGAILRDFCERYGIERGQCIAFGDSLNDLAAFAYTGKTVSMKGSPKELEALASYRAKTEYGVAEGVRHYFPALFS